MSTAMAKREPYLNRIELLQGTLDMLILQALRRGSEHGYGIGQSIRSGSGEVLQVGNRIAVPGAASSGAPGLDPVGVGARRPTINAPSIINSRRPAGRTWPRSTAAGTR